MLKNSRLHEDRSLERGWKACLIFCSKNSDNQESGLTVNTDTEFQHFHHEFKLSHYKTYSLLRMNIQQMCNIN